jgi:hypothetical protein
VTAASLALPEPGPSGPAPLSFLPHRGPVGIRVVLEGQGLISTASVRFGPRPAPFKVVNDQRVDTHVPEGADSAPITLTTAGGRVFTSGAAFQVTREVPGPPVIQDFRPRSGPGGTEVVVSGSGFEAVEEARVGGREAEFTMHTDQAMVVHVPLENPVSGPIAVISPFGTGSSSHAFQVSAQGPPGPSASPSDHDK